MDDFERRPTFHQRFVATRVRQAAGGLQRLSPALLGDVCCESALVLCPAVWPRRQQYVARVCPPRSYTPRYTSFSLLAPRTPCHPRRLASRSSSAATSVPLRSSRSACAEIEDVTIGRDDQTLEPAEMIAASAHACARLRAAPAHAHARQSAHTRSCVRALSHSQEGSNAASQTLARTRAQALEHPEAAGVPGGQQLRNPLEPLLLKLARCGKACVLAMVCHG